MWLSPLLFDIVYNSHSTKLVWNFWRTVRIIEEMVPVFKVLPHLVIPLAYYYGNISHN